MRSRNKKSAERRIDRIVRQLRSSSKLDLRDLTAIWQARASEEWSAAPEIYRLLGDKVLRAGEPLLAHDIVCEGLQHFPQDVRLRQLQGLSLARSGASARAGEILAQLRAEKHADEETLGMLARTYKDAARTAGNAKITRHYLRRASAIYDEAYGLSGGNWTGINAATIALLIGKTARARTLAREVHQACLAEVRRTRADKFWHFATLGEAALILREWATAEEWYARAAEIGGRRFGDLQSSRRNARLLLHHWKKDPALIDQLLRIPQVIVFAGHMIDRPDRRRPRFPEGLERGVAEALRDKVKKLGAGFGFSSAACGADILFAEAMLAAGGEITIVLPYEEQQFVADSVVLTPNSAWLGRFTRILRKATRVVVASPQRLAIGGVSYEYSNQMLLGLATLRANQLETGLVPLAAWDGSSGDGPGGTASVVRQWEKLRLPVERIEWPKLRQPDGRRRELKSVAGEKRQGEFGSQIMAMLFADAVGFSKLTEDEVPRFVQEFLGAVGRLISRKPRGLVARNTWGDGLYLVFSSIEKATDFALDLRDLVTTTDWTKHGLPADLSLRIGLHAGPVYECNDPIQRARNFFGTHVSRAARIEPITPPGQVYASEAFAALAAVGRGPAFRFDYAGQTPMAKGYGTLPMYHVGRT
ncbi:MAG: tetratricopeptide repeat-containing protein [Chthoniobacterales bacterium]